jgi:thiamine-phosphate pyrophosphorylase
MTDLYVIIDPEHCAGRDPLWVAEQALAGGCALLQLRAKQLSDARRLVLAHALAERCRAAQVPLWVNDRADIALLAGAQGLHLGQDDLPVAEARRLVGALPIGLSTHDPSQVEAAVQAGVALIGFGPIFATSSKVRPDPVVGVDALARVCALSRCPVVAIGGIRRENAALVARAGARFAAVIGAVCGAHDPRAAAAALRETLSGA